MASVGAAEEDRALVADELAETAREDQRPPAQARLVLVVAGREPFDAAAFLGDESHRCL